MKNGPYELILAPENYPGMKYRGRYAYEHIIAYWQHTGTIPPEGYEIHHINGNHRDNNISNLKLVTKEEHRKLHGQILKDLHRITFNCGFCNIEVTRKGNHVREGIKNNKSGKLFCSRKCGTLYQFKLKESV